MKIVAAITGVIVLILAIVAGILFFRDSDLENAIDAFEDRDYVGAIEKLNKLILVADYESSEKMHYYRAKSIDRLADKLEKKFEDELLESALEKKNTPDYDEARKEIEDYLSGLNKNLQSDLAFIDKRGRSSIISRGKFYDEFVAKYRGSSFIEDLDFEQLQKIEKTDNGRLIQTMIIFYKKYPNTNYIAHIVKMLFDQLQKGTADITNRGQDLFDIIVTFGRRYPTSPEIGRLFQSTGDNVNLRNSAGLNGQRVGTLKKDEIVIQLEKSMDASQIGDERDYWYRIVSLNGHRGWIFGKFLKEFDITVYKEETVVEKWSIDEHFTEWIDSNTPKEWRHMDDTVMEALGFTERGDLHIAMVNSAKGKSAGLFSRYNASRAFTIECRARYTGGDAVTIFAYSMGNGAVYNVTLKNETIDVCSRIIPVHTGDWHDYRLQSDDGKFATLSIDGEIVSGRILPVKIDAFAMRGLYCLYSSAAEESKGEIQYIKVR